MAAKKKVASKKKASVKNKSTNKSSSTAMVNWDEKLAQDAEIAAGVEAGTGGGQFFSTQGGQLSWQDAPLPNNEMVVVVLDSIFDNVFYLDSYDPDNPSSPTCFALGRSEEDMAPHADVIEQGTHQSTTTCDECEHNEWGTADVGRGKACRNTRRLALIPAGTIDRDGDIELYEDPAHFSAAQIGYLRLPVTSVKAYANYVKQVAGVMKRPPYGIATKVSLVPDAKTQFKVVFEPLDKLDNELMGAVSERNEEAKSLIDFPYQLDDEEEQQAPPKRAASKKNPRKKRSARKY